MYKRYVIVFGVLAVCYAVKLYDASFASHPNNHLYMAAPSLMLQGHDLYSDFYFHQFPYLANIYYLLFAVFGVSFGLPLVLSVLMVGLAAVPIARVKGLEWAALFLLTQPVLANAVQIGNYSWMLAAFSWGWYWKESRPWLAGVLLGIATGIKAYALLFLPLFLLGNRKFGNLIMGFAVGCVPILFYVLRDFDAWWENVVTFHQTYRVMCEVYMDDPSWLQQVKFAFARISNIFYVLPLLFIRRVNFAFLCALYSVALFALLLPTWYDQYFSVTMLFLFWAVDRPVSKGLLLAMLLFFAVSYVGLNLSGGENVEQFLGLDWPVLHSELPEFTCENAANILGERYKTMVELGV